MKYVLTFIDVEKGQEINIGVEESSAVFTILKAFLKGSVILSQIKEVEA